MLSLCFCNKLNTWNALCGVPCRDSTATDNLKGFVWAGRRQMKHSRWDINFHGLVWEPNLPYSKRQRAAKKKLPVIFFIWPTVRGPSSLLKEIFKAVFGWTCFFWTPRRCLPARSCWHQKQNPKRPMYVCEVRKLGMRVVLCWTSAERSFQMQ